MKRALVLQGGTALGAVQVFPIEKLRETHGLSAYAQVAGVSVGAVNGVMFAQDALVPLRALWNQVTGTGFFMGPNVFGPAGILTLNPLRRKIKKHVRLSKIKVPYLCGVVDYETDTYLNLGNHQFSKNGHFYDAICASAAQPILNHGYRVHVKPGVRHLCFDGGVKHSVPMLPKPGSYDAIDVVLCEPTHKLAPKSYDQLDSLQEIAERTFRMMINENVLFNDLQRVLQWANQTEVTVYAPLHHDDEFDASKPAIQRRLDKVGPWMWSHPYKPADYVDAFREARRI